jgi:hypothetical protein
VQPARRLGLEIDEHVVLHRLLPDLEEEALTQDGGLSEFRDAEHTIELPALQIVCEAWYAKAEESHQIVLSAAAYKELGGASTMLRVYLDKTLKTFGSEET